MSEKILCESCDQPAKMVFNCGKEDITTHGLLCPYRNVLMVEAMSWAHQGGRLVLKECSKHIPKENPDPMEVLEDRIDENYHRHIRRKRRIPERMYCNPKQRTMTLLSNPPQYETEVLPPCGTCEHYPNGPKDCCESQPDFD